YLNNVYATIASIFVAMNPNIVISDRLILSETVFTFFTLLGFLLLYLLNDSYKKYIFLGIIVGISYLTRFEGVFLFLIFALWAFKKRKEYFFMFVSSCAIITAPYFYLNFLVNHNPFFTYNSYHFQVHHF